AAYFTSSSNHILNNNYAHGVDVQAAYSLTNHLAVTSSFFYQKEKNVYNYFSSYNKPFDSSLVMYHRNLFDIGGGYFANLNRSNTLSINILGSYSFGKFSFNDNGLDSNGTNYSRYHSSNISRWYLQPAINFTPSEVVTVALIFKPTLVHYANISTSYSPSELDYFKLSNIQNKTKGFIEIATNLQVTIPECPWLKIDFILSRVGENTGIKPGTVRKFNASLGLCVDFSKMKTKK
ncbi:MAG: hypothetical protein JSS85_03775, partial [Bacteroidetes bacterium]|nr:hypothetical protein [Bacteroidota bacterium]